MGWLVKRNCTSSGMPFHLIDRSLWLIGIGVFQIKGEYGSFAQEKVPDHHTNEENNSSQK